jgi:hypothetical protein
MERHEHIAEVNLSLGYPRRAPQCKMLTPIFHPNFDESSICIGDFWAASEGLDDLVVRIGRMITYQEYNTKSPLNGLAAKWAAEHVQLLPVDSSEVAPPSFPMEVEHQAKVVLDLTSDTSSPSVASGSVRVRRSVPRLNFGGVGVALKEKMTTIGRDEDNTVQLAEGSVSGHHAAIIKSGEVFLIRDLGSTNGTKLNRAKTFEAILKDGDQIEFGDAGATFLF